MKYLFITSFIIVYVFFGNELGYTGSSPLCTHITYMFQHAGIVHLALNSIGFICIFHSAQKYINKWILSGLAITSSFIASFLSFYEIPTVGASSMIYAMIGMLLSFSILLETIEDRKDYFVSVLTIIIALSVSAIKHNSNFWLHVFSLLIGLMIGIIVSMYKNREL